MKRMMVVLVVLMVAIGSLSAYEYNVELPSVNANDARIAALGGAFTALADDANALYYNPAGLAFLRGGDLVVGGSFLLDLNSSIIYPPAFDFQEEFGFNPWNLKYDWEEDLVYVDAHSGYGYGDWEYDPEVDDEFDLTVWGFSNDRDGIEEFLAWYDGVIPMVQVIAQGMDSLTLLPNIAYATENWGVGTIAEMKIAPAFDAVLDYSFDITKKSGVIGAIGANLGPFAIGVNAKYYTQTLTHFGLPSTSFTEFEAYVDSLMPDMVLEQAVLEILTNDAIAEEVMTNHFEVGVGGMYTIGSLTVGAYVDSILGFILDENGELSNDYESMLSEAFRTANVGVAFDPGQKKRYGREPFLNLLLMGDLKNIGDDEQRHLNVGAEVGIHLGSLIQGDIRAGYKQYLRGPLEDIFSSNVIRVEEGELSFGAGVRALFFELNMAATIPAVMVKDMITFMALNAFPDDEIAYFTGYESNFPRIMLSAAFSL